MSLKIAIGNHVDNTNISLYLFRVVGYCDDIHIFDPSTFRSTTIAPIYAETVTKLK